MGPDYTNLGDCKWIASDVTIGGEIYYASDDSGPNQAYPPDAAIYRWSDPGGYDVNWRNSQGTIHIVAGGGR